LEHGQTGNRGSLLSLKLSKAIPRRPYHAQHEEAEGNPSILRDYSQFVEFQFVFEFGFLSEFELVSEFEFD